MITKEEVVAFIEKVETEVEDEASKAIAAGLQFLRSVAAALAKDPVMTAAIQTGMADAIAEVAAAVESGGTSVLADAALEAGKALVISAGGTAAHELVPIVTAELHAAVAATTVATPEHVNP
jgi:hypothetical protein